MIETARIRWALPHQASARLLKFCAHAKNNSRPSMTSMYIVAMKSVLTSRSMVINESAVLILSGMAANLSAAHETRGEGAPTVGLIAVPRLAKSYPCPRNCFDRGRHGARPGF